MQVEAGRFSTIREITEDLNESLQNVNATLVQRMVHLNETVRDTFQIFDGDLKNTAQSQEFDLNKAKSHFDKEISTTLYNWSIDFLDKQHCCETYSRLSKV